MRPDAAKLRTLVEAGGVAAEVEESALGEVVRVTPDAVVDALAALKNAGFESLVDLFGCDTGEAVELVYHLRSYAAARNAYVKTTLPYDAEITSVWNLYPSALMPERETAELLGLRLAGHPNPKRLLTTDGIEPLLRKSVPIRTVEEVKRP